MADVASRGDDVTEDELDELLELARVEVATEPSDLTRYCLGVLLRIVSGEIGGRHTSARIRAVSRMLDEVRGRPNVRGEDDGDESRRPLTFTFATEAGVTLEEANSEEPSSGD